MLLLPPHLRGAHGALGRLRAAWPTVGRRGAAARTRDTPPILIDSTQGVLLQVPDEGERCQALDDERLGLTIESASLSYDVEVGYDGPALTGDISVQPYLSADEATLWDEGNALGDPVVVELGGTSATIADTVRLGRTQIDALNERRVCVGLRLSADQLTAGEYGVATIDYELRRLVLRVGFSMF